MFLQYLSSNNVRRLYLHSVCADLQCWVCVCVLHVRMQLCSAAGSASLTPHAPVDSAQLFLALESMSGLDCRISFSLILLLLVSPRFSARHFV